MSIMYTETELMYLGYQASRMELLRATNGPTYDTPAHYVTLVGCQAASQAPTPRELGAIVATMRHWLSGDSQVEGMQTFAAVVAARPFEPEVGGATYPYV